MQSVLEQVRQLRDEESNLERIAAYNKVLRLIEVAEEAREYEALRTARPPAKRKREMPDHIDGHDLGSLANLSTVRKLILKGDAAPFLLVWLEDYESIDAVVSLHTPDLRNVNEYMRERFLSALGLLAGTAKGASLMVLERAARMHEAMVRG